MYDILEVLTVQGIEMCRFLGQGIPPNKSSVYRTSDIAAEELQLLTS